jgi:asparagine synthase (glutamine-hydrolysing)
MNSHWRAKTPGKPEMCGIAGGYWSRSAAIAHRQMKAALDALRHRGPDFRGFESFDMREGVVLLGHARLSVIDLTEAARQPMHSGDGRLTIVFNGEIYNYLELREELESSGHVFRTHSDTEVLMAAWASWGAAALSRFVGMFAFVLVDRERQTLVAARDGFGIKPLYYALDPAGFCFASELPALRILREGRNRLNWQRAYDYLVHGEYDFGSDTFIQDVHYLPPGCMLTLDLQNPNRFRLERWWAPRIDAADQVPFEKAAEQLKSLLLDSVRLHLRSDVPLGAALSGGLDSSSIVCVMRHLEPNRTIHTFSFIAPNSEVSEEIWIDSVNRHVGAKSHKVSVSPGELAADLEDLIATQGEPFGSTSIYAQYRVFKLAREFGMTVTLDGQGADELLGGYNGYPGQRVRSLIEQSRPLEALRFLDAWSQWPGRSRIEGLKRVVDAFSKGSLNHWLRRINGMSSEPDWIRTGPLRERGIRLTFPGQPREYDLPGRRMMGSLASSLSQRGLIGLLRHGDRNSMRFSIESRVPFLTPQLADFSLGLPEEYLVSKTGESKSLLRAAMRGIVPDAILDRKDKIGFATPEKQWLLSISNTVREWLVDDLCLPFLDQRKVVEHFDQIVSGQRPFTWQVWRWINFCRWYKGSM